MLNQVAERIHWLGHDTFRIDAEKIVYIDPFQILPGRPAHIILITHDHFDHCSPEDIAKIRTPETVVVAEKSAAAKLDGDIRIVKAGDVIEVDGIRIEAVPAYNTDKKFHPKANGWVGYVIEIDGCRIYHAGDTDLIDEMRTIKADVALLPVSGTYVMTAQQAAEAARLIKPKMAIPMHYGAVVGTEKDAQAFRNALSPEIEAGEIKVLILKVRKESSD